MRLPLTGCTADPGGRPGWVAASSAGLTWWWWYPAASHHPLSFLSLLGLSFPLYFPFLSLFPCFTALRRVEGGGGGGERSLGFATW